MDLNWVGITPHAAAKHSLVKEALVPRRGAVDVASGGYGTDGGAVAREAAIGGGAPESRDLICAIIDSIRA